jgi:hypothetical protein
MRLWISASGVPSSWCSCNSRNRSSIKRRLLRVDAGGIAEIQHRIFRRAQEHALMAVREKATAPQMARRAADRFFLS